MDCAFLGVNPNFSLMYESNPNTDGASLTLSIFKGILSPFLIDTNWVVNSSIPIIEPLNLPLLLLIILVIPLKISVLRAEPFHRVPNLLLKQM